MTIFKSTEARATVTAWHQRFREKIGRPTQSRLLQTRSGYTHVLFCGPEEAPPLVLLHGALASSAHALLEVASLADHYRIIALDIIGQSPLSAEVRPDVNGPAYGQWVIECLDALELSAVRLLGVSWGGFVALRAAALAPERILKLSLVVPAGLVTGSGKEGFLKIALPMMIYCARPSQARLENCVRYLFTTYEPDWVNYMGDAFRAYKLDFRPPRLLRDSEMSALTAPVQVFGAENDLSFPGPALLARAKIVFPNLVCCELLENTRHAPSFEPDARRRLAGAIDAFMGES
jgi:pimeloyl-ACP methyl ester carboxylesterase